MNLQEKQERGLGILLAIDTVCKKHNIRYRLDSGTLLGAVRHKGFIPWDDDVDLCFLREEWEKFVKVAKEDLPAPYALVLPNEYRGGKAFYDFVPRVVDLYTKRRDRETEGDQFYEGKLNHLWVDCFIADSLPKNSFLNRLYRFRQQLIFGLAMGHRRVIHFKKYKGMSKLFVSVLSKLGYLIPMPLLFSLQDKWAKRESVKQLEREKKNSERKKTEEYSETIENSYSSVCSYYFSNYQPDFQYCSSQSDWEEPLIEGNFQGHKLPIPKGYDAILRMLYGKYEILPKEENRIPSHEDMI